MLVRPTPALEREGVKARTSSHTASMLPLSYPTGTTTSSPVSVCCFHPHSPAVNNKGSVVCCHMGAHLLHKGDESIRFIWHAMVWPGDKLEVMYELLLVPL